MIGTRTQFYRHMHKWEKLMIERGLTVQDFFKQHGEIPYNDDNPRDNLSAQLAKSLELEALRRKIYNEL